MSNAMSLKAKIRNADCIVSSQADEKTYIGDVTGHIFSISMFDQRKVITVFK